MVNKVVYKTNYTNIALMSHCLNILPDRTITLEYIGLEYNCTELSLDAVLPTLPNTAYGC